MNRRKFMAAVAGGVAGALGIALAVKKCTGRTVSAITRPKPLVLKAKDVAGLAEQLVRDAQRHFAEVERTKQPTAKEYLSGPTP